MLQQAVIDAQALKEAAIKNAEQEVLKKYSGEIKEAVDSLLEEEPITTDDSMDLNSDETPTEAIVEDIPLKATEGLDDQPDQGEMVELNLDELRTSMVDKPIEEPMFEVSEAELENLLSENEKSKPDYIDIDNDGDKEESMKQAAADKEKDEIKEEINEDELELNEEELKDAIEEILKVDYEVVPRGKNGQTHATKVGHEWALEASLAKQEDTETKETDASMVKAIEKIQKLEEQVKSLKSDKNRLAKDHNELKSIACQVSDKLTEINTSNAKLVYQNRILKSPSLNERQKTNLVEAVSKANSTEEAKVIFETLQDSLISKEPSAPKNLNEAVSKNNRLILKSQQTPSQSSDSTSVRMKRLAGII